MREIRNNMQDFHKWKDRFLFWFVGIGAAIVLAILRPYI